MLFLRVSILAWFAMFGTLVNAFDNYDECGHLQRLITENIGLIGADNTLPYEIRNNYGFEFYTNEEGEVPTTIEHVYTQTRDNYDYEREDYNALLGNDLFKINNKSVVEMDYEQFLAETSGRTIELEVFDYDKIFKFSKDDYKFIEVFLTPKIKSIYEIDPKHGRFGSNFSLQTTWYDDRLLAVAEKVYRQGLKISPENGVGEDKYTSYYCDLTETFMNENRVLYPKVEPKDFRSEIDREASSFILTYFPEDNSETHSVELTRTQNFQGFVNTEFDLKKFPFDKQYLDIKFVPVENDFLIDLTIGFYITSQGGEAVDTIFETFTNNSWNAVDYFYQPTYSFSDVAFQFVNSYEISLFLERNVEYYIFKLMLPIILLLALTWSIFWIDIKDLETRITISIVTFLALIAYNFVIDNDLAKLSYLTFLDSVILISYLFAGLPTFMAIYCKRKVLNKNKEWGEKINSLSKGGFPLIYALSVGSLMLGFDINPFESFLNIGSD